MMLRDLKPRILAARHECFKKQQASKKKSPEYVKIEFNPKVSFYIINSGYDLMIAISKKEKQHELIMNQYSVWVNNNFVVMSNLDVGNPETYGPKIDTIKYNMKIWQLDANSKS